MKKNILLFVLSAVILCMPRLARADFFNDGRWYMDSAQWNLVTAWDPEGRASLTDQNNRLEWITAPGWTDNYESFRCYASNWVFDLNHDFEFNIGFHYNHSGTYDTDEGGMQMGLINWQGGSEPSHFFSLAAENWVSRWNGENLSNKNVFWSAMETPDTEAENWFRRINADGMLYARYIYSEDELQFQAFEGSYPDWELVGGSEYDKLRSEMGLSQLRVYLSGWSEGAGLSSGDAYLQNFNLVRGTVTPEPISCALFLVGGGALVLVRRRKPQKNFPKNT